MKIYPNLTGWSLVLGGVLFLIANTVLTLLMPVDGSSAEIFGSGEFLRRLSVAAACVFFLLVGAIGLYARQAHKTGWFGGLAFAIAFIGCATAFAHEWGQVFFLHDLANTAPEGLNALVDREGLNLYLIEVFLALVPFMLGWWLFAISMLMARVFSPLGPILLIAGFIAVPVLAATLPDLWGFVVGNTIIGFGWVILGWELARSS